MQFFIRQIISFDIFPIADTPKIPNPFHAMLEISSKMSLV